MFEYSEETISYMRQLRAESDMYYEKSRYAPGTIPVGSQCKRYEIQAELRAVILRWLGKTQDLFVIRCEVHKEVAFYIEKWNKQRSKDWQVQIWENAFDGEIDRILTRLMGLILAPKSQTLPD